MNTQRGKDGELIILLVMRIWGIFGRKGQHLSGVTQPSLNLSHFSCPCISVEHRRKDNGVPPMDVSRWIFKDWIPNICVQLRWKQVWSFLQAPPHVFGHLNTIKSLSWIHQLTPERSRETPQNLVTREWGLEANVQPDFVRNFYPLNSKNF